MFWFKHSLFQLREWIGHGKKAKKRPSPTHIHTKHITHENSIQCSTIYNYIICIQTANFEVTLMHLSLHGILSVHRFRTL